MNSTSLRWKIEEYEVLSETEKQVKVKVKALRPTMSRNGRKYDFDEMMQSHRSIRNQIINVNHNNQRVIGNTDGSNINKEQQVMEVFGTVNKEPYVYMVKTHDPKIRGWSVQADFMKAKCVHCPREFETMEALKTHLEEEEHIHNIVVDPREIKFNGLALVVDPEVPGMPGTSYEIAETAKVFGSLQEMVDSFDGQPNLWLLKFMSNSEEQKKMSKIAVETQSNIAVGHSKTISQSPPAKSEPATPPQTTQKPQVAKTITEAKLLTLGEPCSPELKACVDSLIADGKDESSAWAICKAKIGETFTVREGLKLGELTFKPIQVPDFEALRKTKTVEESAREIGFIEEVNQSFNMLASSVNELQKEISKPLKVTVTYPEPKLYDDKSIRETIANIKPYDDAPLKEATEKAKADLVDVALQTGVNKQSIEKIQETLKELPTIKESIATIPKDDTAWKDHIANHPQDNLEWQKIKDDESWKPRLEAQEKREIPLAVDIKPITEKMAVFETKLTTLEAENKTLKETINKVGEENKKLTEVVTEQNANYEATLKKADNNTGILKQEITEIKKQLDDERKKNTVLTETVAQQDKQIKETQVRTDNLEDKTTASFKGHAKRLVENQQQTPDFTYTPGAK